MCWGKLEFIITCDVKGYKDLGKAHWTFKWLNKELEVLYTEDNDYEIT